MNLEFRMGDLEIERGTDTEQAMDGKCGTEQALDAKRNPSSTFLSQVPEKPVNNKNHTQVHLPK